MKKIILDLAVTLDGFIEGPNGEIDWCIMDDEMNFDGFMAGIDTIFYGRVSYDTWGNYRPDTTADAAELLFWDTIRTKEKYVFTTQHKEDEIATFVSNDIARQVNEIKKRGGKDIWLYGGASLIKTFIELDLIDLYRISVHPVALGSGKPLFEHLKERVNLELIETQVYQSGVVQLIYKPTNRVTSY